MKIFLVASACLLATAPSLALELSAREASMLVKKFSEAVACATEDNQYKAVKVAEGDKELNGMGAAYVVFWYGDIGCYGGNGTVTPNFTVVGALNSGMPVVSLDSKLPDMDLAALTSLTAKNGILTIKGVTYGPNDQQHQPKKPVTYRLKFVDGKLVKQ